MNNHYNTPDENTGNQMLQIAFNMNKCKFVQLDEKAFRNSDRMDSTHIFISLNTIFSDWYFITGGNYGEVTSEEIVARIFELCIHYRRYFDVYKHSKEIKIYLYYSFDYYNSFPEVIMNNDFNLINEIKDAMEILSTVVMYIPGLYLINTGNMNPGILPFYVESTYRDELTRSGKVVNHNALIVSAKDVDYSSLGITATGINQNFKVYAFRRKHGHIFTKDNIFENLIFKNRKEVKKYVGYFIWFYPKILMMYAGRFGIVNSSDYISKDLRKDINKHLFDSDLDDSNMSIWMTEISDKIRSNPRLNELNELVDVPRVYIDKLQELHQMEHIWKNDRIDYSIEKLNGTYFKHFLIDWASLF